MTTDYSTLPDDLPEPIDDGAADHLPGTPMPALTLPATDGTQVRLDEPRPGRTVLYLYPMTGEPGTPLPDGWNEIPGARGCTPESSGFRDHHAELAQAGAPTVFGLSSQSTEYQTELARRLALPFPILSDEPPGTGAAADAADLRDRRDAALPTADDGHRRRDDRTRLLPGVPA